MLTVKEILRVTPKAVKERSKTVKIIKVRKAVIATDKTFFFLNARTVNDAYDCQVILETFEKLSKNKVLNSDTWVHCSCPFYQYHSEHALWKKGSSSRLLTHKHLPGQGVTGVKVNPKLIPYVCKHLVAVFNQLHKIKVTEGKVPIDMMIKYNMPGIEKYIPKDAGKVKKKK
jgi:hypothetical protein